MLFIESYETDPHYNLALEEYLFLNKTEEIFMLWQNHSSIIIGKNQNAMAEVDYSYVTQHDIPVVRRLSGGGAVYHDLGNLNFTYIVNRDSFGDYVGFTKILRDFLETQGISACVSGRNDVLVGDKKISGNAQYSHHGRLLHHGTILIEADMQHLGKALKPDEEKIRSKGVKSVQSRVMNLSELLPYGAEGFRKAFTDFVLKTEEVNAYSLTAEDRMAVEKLCAEKYNTYEWNYGYSSRYSFHTKKRFSGGGVEVCLDIQDGMIRNAKIFGDFLGDATPLEERLCGTAHTVKAIENILADVKLGTIEEKELLSCFF